MTIADPAFGSGLAVGYRASTKSYVVAGQGFSYTFAQTDRVSGSDPRFDYYAPSFDRILSVGPRDAQYARSLSLLGTSNGSVFQLVNCILGVPTQADDVPKADRNYQVLLLTGSAFTNSMSYDLSGSTVTLSFDQASKAVKFTVNVAGKRTSFSAGEPADTNVYTLGRIDGVTPGIGTSTAFAGTLTSPVSSDVTGRFGGSLFGPGGQEVALVFKFGGSGPDGAPFSGRGTLIVGATN